MHDEEKRRQAWLGKEAGQLATIPDLPAVREMTLPADIGVLDAIGKLSPNDWYWNGRGFYDNRPGHWASFPSKEMINYEEFKKRIKIASEENSRH